MGDPQIEVTEIETLPGMSANAQAMLALSDWMIECADRAGRPWGNIPLFPSDEIEPPHMRCGCDGSQHPGHPEHTGNMTNQEQQAVAIFLLRLEVETPANWLLVRYWLDGKFPNNKPLWDRSRDPPLYWDEDAYAGLCRTFRREAAETWPEERLLSRATQQFRDDTQRHDRWLADTARVKLLREMLGRMPCEAPLRTVLSADIRSVELSIYSFGAFYSKERPLLRTLEEQRVWTAKDAAERVIRLDRQIAEERQKVEDSVPEFRAFLAGLTDSDW